jgi:predicted transcriptional regulator
MSHIDMRKFRNREFIDMTLDQNKTEKRGGDCSGYSKELGAIISTVNRKCGDDPKEQLKMINRVRRNMGFI